MQYLNQNDLKKMMLLSYERIEKEKEQINKINVFPVPDQDTGNNMAKTLSGIKKAIQDKNFKTINDISEAILDGALTAAQGNAGVIYTGFLVGFLPELTEKIDVKNLATAFEKGAERAKQSIQDPKQGTILDVIDAAALTFKTHSNKEQNIIHVFEKAVESANKALVLTKEKLEILKKADVVDAGGMGFLIILESSLKALEGESKKIEKEERPSEKVKRFIQIISNRYEVVALIANPVLKTKEIKERLKKLGNSIDVIQVKNKIKIHIHSDYPDDVRTALRKMGEIKNLRIEDMAKEIIGEESIRPVSVGLVTETSSMLLPKIVERYRIELIDCEKNWPLEKASKQSIFEKIKKVTKFKPKSSGLTTKIYLDAFKKQLQEFTSVLCITGSSKLYDYHALANKARSMISKPKRVFVLDSLNIGTGQALVLLKAIELTQEQYEINETIEELNGFLAKIQSYIISQSIRKTKGKTRIHSTLEVKKGTIVRGGVILAQDVAEIMSKKILRQSKKFKKIRTVLGYIDNVEIIHKIKDNLKSKIKVEVPFINLIPASVGSIIGRENMIVSWTGLQKK